MCILYVKIFIIFESANLIMSIGLRAKKQIWKCGIVENNRWLSMTVFLDTFTDTIFRVLFLKDVLFEEANFHAICDILVFVVKEVYKMKALQMRVNVSRWQVILTSTMQAIIILSYMYKWLPCMLIMKQLFRDRLKLISLL